MVDHFFKHRITSSVVHASDYLKQFPSPIISIVAKFVSFVSGGFAAILLIIAFMEESLLEGHIFGRNLFWYAAVFGTITAISRAAVTDDLLVLDPDGAMSMTVQHTHYMPKRWRGNEHTETVRKEFETLFQPKTVLMKDSHFHPLKLLLLLLTISLSSPFHQANASENITDRLSLLEFKQGITNDPDGVLNSWNDSFHLCVWPGITCNKQQRVISISLPASKLTGTLSQHIGNFTFLQSINLINNSFHGQIPNQIGNLHQLQTLNLTWNFLTGEIPANLTRCSELRIVRVEANSLEGKLPEDIGSLSKLQVFRMGTNHLTGRIPASLGNFSQLFEFAVAYNNLVGEIPETVGQLPRINNFIVGVNQLNGTIPLSLYNSSTLAMLVLIYNQFQGMIPEDIGFTLPNLKAYAISKNWMSGKIPQSLCNASQLEIINMNRNSFTGRIPTCYGSLAKLSTLHMAANNLGTNSSGDFEFMTGLANCSQLQGIGVGSNNLGGSLPNSIGNLSVHVNRLEFDYNQVKGTIPDGMENLVNLIRVDLSGNLLTGKIPDYVGKLQSLQGLLLSGNKLSGQIPSSFGNLSMLNRLNISNNRLEGVIPSSLGRCRQLNLLDVSANKLRGEIPKQVFTLSSLSNGLYLSGNSLEGQLPDEIGNLINVAVLDLSDNSLTGGIPSTIGDCKGLQALYMQSNSFNGSIPAALASLQGVGEMDLSWNNFTGEIPSGLQNIQALRRLNLSFNDLQGEVPNKGVFANASGISVIGNDLLCGGVLELQLQKCPTVAKTTKQKRVATIKLTLIIVLPSLAFLFLSGILYQYKLWRSRKQSCVRDSVLSQFTMVSYKDLHQGTNGFSPENVIGSGGFGTVYKGMLDQMGKTPIAVKVMNLQENIAHKSLLAECNALKNLRHRNLVRLLTYCSSLDHKGNDFKALVFELMPNGSLEDWLHSPGHGVLSLIQRLNILVDVASALHYLHDLCGTPIVHCDLKPSNVLLDADLVAHIGDFGLARMILSSNSSSGNETSTIRIKGTIGYAPPEYGMGMTVSKEGDVYSYGILVLEMFTGKRPTDEMFKDGMNLRDFVKASSHDGIISVLDQSMTIPQATVRDRGQARNREANDNDEIRTVVSDLAESAKECFGSLLEIGEGCSTDLAGDRMKTADIARKMTSVRDTFVAATTIRMHRPLQGSLLNQP
ncbi:Probable LRR receptor-like serine/threonine-protein kinase At3g47570 [Linum perenne]